MAKTKNTDTEPPADEAPERRFGWRPDQLDPRDHKFALAPGAQRLLPPNASLSLKMEPPIGDQANLGSCTGWMATYLHEQLRRKSGLASSLPSPLATYYWTRLIEGGLAQTKQDSGATIRDAVRSLAINGAAPEELWPYVPAKFAVRPSAAAQNAAAQRQVISYQRVTSLDGIKASIVDGYPVGFGFLVFPSMMTAAVARSGKVPMPGAGEAPEGGHACAFVAYNDTQRLLLFRNQWGGSWGRGGYGYLPYEYVTNRELCQDWWTIRAVES